MFEKRLKFLLVGFGAALAVIVMRLIDLQVVRAGDTLVSPPGSEHSFDVLPEEDCVAGVILTAGIEMPPGTRAHFD